MPPGSLSRRPSPALVAEPPVTSGSANIATIIGLMIIVMVMIAPVRAIIVAVPVVGVAAVIVVRAVAIVVPMVVVMVIDAAQYHRRGNACPNATPSPTAMGLRAIG
jgi:hypothetical protein